LTVLRGGDSFQHPCQERQFQRIGCRYERLQRQLHGLGRAHPLQRVQQAEPQRAEIDELATVERVKVDILVRLQELADARDGDVALFEQLSEQPIEFGGLLARQRFAADIHLRQPRQQLLGHGG